MDFYHSHNFASGAAKLPPWTRSPTTAVWLHLLFASSAAPTPIVALPRASSIRISALYHRTMTANMSTAAMATEPAPYQQHAYKRSATYTPIDSGMTTPTNVSPTSPRSSTLPIHNHAPQIRRPKNPIYVPAALRRTELPSRQSPPKVDSVMDSPNGSWGSGPGCAPVAGDGSASLPMIATEDLNTIYNDMPLTPVAGPITRNHWAVRQAFPFPLFHFCPSLAPRSAPPSSVA